ncbi:hypothetical protein TPHA_0I01150 [Tetrapisispora phaffii CBS 4417]|uniref:Uncharacterized protein n=1 Tax=Tetrapisispora phaffii (strain ATCC 24235 / CBS 4417 / NBRC 1672 / NRRL Y-8282 / UCD 70-5) TaxID=1071381 RepID=G8BXJ3_TETPH|nr:hypothetical protein TPHA_0I01150 [Tetrapisispora phaffii CBS 4417]CCE64621.1 hypothetical protein TPHA_0I01150 [Tetrapisispora phaffii CBS 4417]
MSSKRRNSLCLDDYEANIVAPQDELSTRIPKITHVKSSLTLDDLDMVSLHTEFDQQMLLGFPMYADGIENATFNDKLSFNMFNKQNGSLEHGSSTSIVDESNTNESVLNSDTYVDDDIQAMNTTINRVNQNRIKYIKRSMQDNLSDFKNDVNNWLMYPKPLPKFWRFDRDKRFQNFRKSDNEIDPLFDLKHETNYAAEYGCNSDSNDDIREGDDDNEEEDNFTANQKYQNDFFQFTLPVDRKTKSHIVEPYKKLGEVSYVGEYFSITHYQHLLKNYNEKYDVKDFYCRDPDYLDKTSEIPSFEEFCEDFFNLLQVLQNRNFNVIAEKRLVYLNNKFDLFQHLNQRREIQENKHVPYRDFYNCRKVDRNFYLSGCVQQKQLCDFIWEKINIEPERIVYVDEKLNKEYKLIDIFQLDLDERIDPNAIGFKIIDDEFLDWYKLFYLTNYHIIPHSNFTKGNIETLPPLTPKHLKFYLIATTFLEFNNYMDGEYLAEIFIKYVIHYLELNKYLLAQVTVDFQFYDIKSTSGKPLDPLTHYCHVNNWWIRFSNWISKWNVVSNNIRWNVNITRLYPRLFSLKLVENFKGFLDYIFKPLFDEDNINKNINLQYFLSTLAAMDLSVKNSDSYIWKAFTNIRTTPNDWISKGDNPPVAYYMYYLFQKISKFNIMRNIRKQNSIVLRNSSSTLRNRTSQFGTSMYFSEHAECLAANILLSNGGMLSSYPIWSATPLTQYFYYLLQIPMIASPLSSVSSLENNNFQNIDPTEEEAIYSLKMRDITLNESICYSKNPYMKLFQIGMKISLSCQSILFNKSYTREPLMEEYSVAASIYLLNAADVCELARNSVICSDFDGWYKRHWLGVTIERTLYEHDTIGASNVWYDINGPYGRKGTSMRHNVPFIRRTYRNKTLNQEWIYVNEQL